MITYGYENTLTKYNLSSDRSYYIARVTNIFYYETENNGTYNVGNSKAYSVLRDESENSSFDVKSDGFFVSLLPTDMTNVPVLARVVGVPEKIDVGDFVFVENRGGSNFVTKKVYSKSSTWDNAVKTFERPIHPYLELRGSYGQPYTYNATYLTFLPGYTTRENRTDIESVWYDRFIRNNSGVYYKNYKSLGEYTPWVRETLDNPQNNTDAAKALVKIVESPFLPDFMGRFFYLGENLLHVRPDPVFDVGTPLHQANNASPVIYSERGIDFGRFSLERLNQYPFPLTKQQIDGRVRFTAYDKVINRTLLRAREGVEEADILNTRLPLDAKESHEISIGRNQLIISDIHGDGSQLLITLKSEKDQGFSVFYDDRDAWSQIRIRGAAGESILLESANFGAGYVSRSILRTLSGQFIEMFDNTSTPTQNYIYATATDFQNNDNSSGSYMLLTNGNPPGNFIRIKSTETLGTGIYAGVYGTNAGFLRLFRDSTGSNADVFVTRNINVEAANQITIKGDSRVRVESAEVEVQATNVSVQSTNVSVNTANATVSATANISLLSNSVTLGSGGPLSAVARLDDSISILLDSAALGNLRTAMNVSGGTIPAGASFTATGKITSGSTKVSSS